MRLIDADALMNRVCENLRDGDVLDRIPPCFVDDAPTVDAVVVTRCKDCKNAYINSFSAAPGEALCTLSGQPMQQDDFCSYGEPKEGENADDHD